MANRREVLQAAMGVTALPFVAKLNLAQAADRMHFQTLVYDKRFEAGVAFARKFEGQGFSIHAISGDVTDLWYKELYYRWRSNPVAIAGLTTHGSLFCLEHLAWEHRLRLTYLAEHSQCSDGEVEHTLSDPQSRILRADINALRFAGERWPESLAELIVRNSVAASTAIPNVFVGRNGMTRSGHAQESLFSWVLTPLRHA
ncbi:MAG: hypothetical protein AB7I12_04145 [Steroidobacteraceae bacterium]